ncbi:hypothetical protein ACJX0J_004793 (mitochondrion) [Zea mays]
MLAFLLLPSLNISIIESTSYYNASPEAEAESTKRDIDEIRRRGSDEGTEEERNEEPHGDDDRDHTEKEENSSVKIKSDIPLIMPKGVEGIRICCSGRLGGAEIKIDYAPAEGRAISETNQIIYYSMNHGKHL